MKTRDVFVRLVSLVIAVALAYGLYQVLDALATWFGRH